VQQNKHIVFCSTTLGGHLSWFEIGGERWFSRAAAAFLQKMANDVDLKALKQSRSSGTENGSVVRRTTTKNPKYLAHSHKLQDPEPNPLVDI
jgi:hypothetical protein